MAENKYLSLSIDELNAIDKTELSNKALSLLNEAIKSKETTNKKLLFSDAELQKLINSGVINVPSTPYTPEQDGSYQIRVTSKDVTKGKRQRVIVMGECSPNIPNRDTLKPSNGLTLNNLLILKQLYEGIVLSFNIKEVTFSDGSIRRFATDFEVVE